MLYIEEEEKAPAYIYIYIYIYNKEVETLLCLPNEKLA
jgi:hypothetical protein